MTISRPNDAERLAEQLAADIVASLKEGARV
jgi:hypothetical protein